MTDRLQGARRAGVEIASSHWRRTHPPLLRSRSTKVFHCSPLASLQAGEPKRSLVSDLVFPIRQETTFFSHAAKTVSEVMLWKPLSGCPICQTRTISSVSIVCAARWRKLPWKSANLALPIASIYLYRKRLSSSRVLCCMFRFYY